MASLNERGCPPEDREERLLIASTILGRPIGSFDDLTAGDASTFIDTLARTKDHAQLMTLLDEFDTAQQGPES